MTETSGKETGLPGAARWAAVAVLGLAGLAGVIRAWIVAPPRMLEPSAASLHGATGAEVDEDPVSAGAGAGTAPGATDAAESVARRINVNTASAAELDLLPGIGPAYAGRIIADREANGPFRTLDDLDRVPGIGAKTVAKLAPYASVE